MSNEFAHRLSMLRKESRMNQRSVAAKMEISQALLSHYENGIREPGLEFVIKACNFYGVSADYLLGRTGVRDGGVMFAPEPEEGLPRPVNHKRTLVGCVSLIFDCFGKALDDDQAAALADCLYLRLYELVRALPVALPEGAVPEGGAAERVAGILFDEDILSVMGVKTKDQVSFEYLEKKYPERSRELIDAVNGVAERIRQGLTERGRG